MTEYGKMGERVRLHFLCVLFVKTVEIICLYIGSADSYDTQYEAFLHTLTDLSQHIESFTTP
jgi:hypothetical protein